jgi:hypothetical protein
VDSNLACVRSASGREAIGLLKPTLSSFGTVSETLLDGPSEFQRAALRLPDPELRVIRAIRASSQNAPEPGVYVQRQGVTAVDPLCLILCV